MGEANLEHQQYHKNEQNGIRTLVVQKDGLDNMSIENLDQALSFNSNDTDFNANISVLNDIIKGKYNMELYGPDLGTFMLAFGNYYSVINDIESQLVHDQMTQKEIGESTIFAPLSDINIDVNDKLDFAQDYVKNNSNLVFSDKSFKIKRAIDMYKIVEELLKHDSYQLSVQILLSAAKSSNIISITK